jgi:hypothetical protein
MTGLLSMTRNRDLTAAVGLCAVALVVASLARGATTAFPRVTSTAVENELKQNPWPDGRILADARCLGTDAVRRNGDFYAAHSVCLLESWTRPPSVTPSLWSQLGTAVRTHNIARLLQLLGLPANATAAEVTAASRRVGLDRAHASTAGIQLVSSTAWRTTRSPIAAAAFVPSWNARHSLLGVLPAVEAYYADHHTYVGATPTRLAASPYNTPFAPNVRIISTSAKGYCVQATAASTTWSEAGPDGAPVLKPCS